MKRSRSVARPSTGSGRGTPASGTLVADEQHLHWHSDDGFDSDASVDPGGTERLHRHTKHQPAHTSGPLTQRRHAIGGRTRGTLSDDDVSDSNGAHSEDGERASSSAEGSSSAESDASDASAADQADLQSMPLGQRVQALPSAAAQLRRKRARSDLASSQPTQALSGAKSAPGAAKPREKHRRADKHAPVEEAIVRRPVAPTVRDAVQRRRGKPLDPRFLAASAQGGDDESARRCALLCVHTTSACLLSGAVTVQRCVYQATMSDSTLRLSQSQVNAAIGCQHRACCAAHATNSSAPCAGATTFCTRRRCQ